MTRMIIIPDTARCRNCKKTFDLPLLRERKDYIPGLCPLCGGYLKSARERIKTGIEGFNK